MTICTGGGDEANDCSSQFSPCATIGHAIEEAHSGDVLLVDCGVYNESVTIDKSLGLFSFLSGSDCVHISPSSGRAVRIVEDVAASLTDIVLVGGQATQGGAVLAGED